MLKIILQLMMFAWGVCLLLTPAFQEVDGRTLGNVWIVGSIIVGAIPNRR